MEVANIKKLPKQHMVHSSRRHEDQLANTFDRLSIAQRQQHHRAVNHYNHAMIQQLISTINNCVPQMSSITSISSLKHCYLTNVQPLFMHYTTRRVILSQLTPLVLAKLIRMACAAWDFTTISDILSGQNEAYKRFLVAQILLNGDIGAMQMMLESDVISVELLTSVLLEKIRTIPSIHVIRWVSTLGAMTDDEIDDVQEYIFQRISNA
jgi:hypothetical protein